MAISVTTTFKNKISAFPLTVVSGGGGGGVTDHGALTGLGDDDHTQYHNDTRGDARYSLLAHTHSTTDLTEGTKLFFTSARTLAVLLNGFAVSPSRDTILATHTIIEAFGKCQKYFDDLSALAFSASTSDITEGSKLFYTNARALGSVLTGFSVAGSRTTITSADDLLVAFGKVQKYLNDLSTAAFTASSSDIVEGTKLFFTEARVLATTLAGFSVAGSRTAITSADNVNTALGKAQKYFNDLVASAYSDTTVASNISSGTLSDSRLSSNVGLKNANNTWTGIQTLQQWRWSSTRVETTSFTIADTDFDFGCNNGSSAMTVTFPDPTSSTYEGRVLCGRRYNTGSSGTITCDPAGSGTTIQSETGSRPSSTTIGTATFARQMTWKANSAASSWDLLWV